MAKMVEDILAPLVRHLRSYTGLLELRTLIPEGGTNPVLGPPLTVLHEGDGPQPYTGSSAPWIFRGFSQTGEPHVAVEGTGSCALTLEEASPWSAKRRGSSLIFPTIKIYYHCDVTRDLTIGAPVAYDARDKCLTLHQKVSKLLHVKDNGTPGFMFWGPKEDGSGALKVVTSIESSGLYITPIYQGDGLVEGQATFNLEVFL